MARAKIGLPDHFLFSTEIEIRISDINYGGHLGNDSLLSILQEARLRFLKHFGFSEENVAGYGIIMADAVIIYKSQAYYGDVLKIEITVDDFSKHAFDMIYRISKNPAGREVARAKTRIAFFDYQKNITVSIPQSFNTIFYP
jgi:acyl-CoA thioester hydrolase